MNTDKTKDDEAILAQSPEALQAKGEELRRQILKKLNWLVRQPLCPKDLKKEAGALIGNDRFRSCI